MKKLQKRTKGLLATRCLLRYTTRFKTQIVSIPVPYFQDPDPVPRPMAWLSCCYLSLLWRNQELQKPKSQQKIAPRQKVPKSPYKKKTWCSRTLMVQCFATLLPERRRSLGFVLVLPLSVPWESGQEEKSREIARRNCSRRLRFNWFCLLC